MSSANLPRPRSSRFSSLRGIGCPTHFLAPSFLIALTGFSSSQGRLQSINQFLHLFSPQRLQQAASHGGQTAEDLRFTLPSYFCAAVAVERRQIKARGERDVASGHASLPFVLRPGRTL